MPTLSSGSLVVPGQYLCPSTENYTVGGGTYLRGDSIYSSLTGFLDFKNDDKEIIVEVNKGFERSIVPGVGDIITAKVTNIRRRYAKCSIHCIEDTVLPEPFRGILRKEEVRMKERDKVEMYKCYRPGDIILAKVSSLGAMHSYNLTTAEDELGVSLALSEAGAEMIPTSWTEMMCTKTFAKESRKVAKIVPQNFTQKNFAKFQQGMDV
ncbi:exosome complex component CSL4 [Parasteatoda tepidariorum]|uniref:exosome complex component CSL4 n=1 Tax=Parasteatoda tepidariorum TaxID=114398 RepID=UPI00077F9E83|nr:exosome complex component CSL4 [Parasteatoda tepidariorum]